MSTGILYDTGSLLYDPGETKVFAPPVATSSDDSQLQTAISNAPYNTTGTFTLGFRTTTFQAVLGGGGGTPIFQTTVGGGTVNVIYNYTESNTPEPATMALLGSALIGIGVIRRRKLAPR